MKILMMMMMMMIFNVINGNNCETFCYKHKCDELNGNTSNECGSCSNTYLCNYN